MKYTPFQTYAVLLQKGTQIPAATPLATGLVLTQMEQWLAGYTCKSDMRLCLDTALSLFRVYCQDRPEVAVTDDLPAQFQAWASRLPPESRPNSKVDSLEGPFRALLNGAGLEYGWLARPLLTRGERQRFTRITALSPETRSMIVFFEKHARQVRVERQHIQDTAGNVTVRRQYRLLKRPLAPYAVYNRIDRAISLLRRLGKRCFRDLTTADLRQFVDCESDAHARHNRLVGEVAPLFANLHLSGYLTENPFAAVDFSAPEHQVRSDFLTPKNMGMLLQASAKIDEMKPRLARALLFSLLAYDTAMRLRELLHLTLQDIIVEPGQDMVSIRVRSEYQKGHGKQERPMVLLFPETRLALRRYLNGIRQRFAPKCDALFVSSHGTELSTAAATVDIDVLTAHFGIRTFKGERVTAHIFRHTFATLNIDPLGLKLSLEEVIQRLRHDDRDVARKVYITDNPYQENQRHQVRLEQTRRQDPCQLLRTMPPEMLLNWLSTDIRVPAAVLKKLQKCFTRKEERPEEKAGLKPNRAENPTVAETDALALLAAFNLTESGLRQFANSKGVCRCIDGEWFYAEAFIWELKQEYVTQADALARLACTQRTLYHRGKMLGMVVLGKVMLLRRSAVQNFAVSKARHQFRTQPGLGASPAPAETLPAKLIPCRMVTGRTVKPAAATDQSSTAVFSGGPSNAVAPVPAKKQPKTVHNWILGRVGTRRVKDLSQAEWTRLIADFNAGYRHDRRHEPMDYLEYLQAAGDINVDLRAIYRDSFVSRPFDVEPHELVGASDTAAIFRCLDDTQRLYFSLAEGTLRGEECHLLTRGCIIVTPDEHVEIAVKRSKSPAGKRTLPMRLLMPPMVYEWFRAWTLNFMKSTKNYPGLPFIPRSPGCAGIPDALKSFEVHRELELVFSKIRAILKLKTGRNVSFHDLRRGIGNCLVLRLFELALNMEIQPAAYRPAMAPWCPVPAATAHELIDAWATRDQLVGRPETAGAVWGTVAQTMGHVDMSSTSSVYFQCFLPLDIAFMDFLRKSGVFIPWLIDHKNK